MDKRELRTLQSVKAISFKDTDTAVFVGTIVDKKDSKFGDICFFTYESSTAPVKVKDDSGKQVQVEVNEGDRVAVFASGQLKDKLDLARPGDRIEIKYNGKKLNPKSGRHYNDYTVSVIEN